MNIEHRYAPDPAAVFASALSLWQECQKQANNDENLNLSESYNGLDEFMREIMRVATHFETWACQHIDFDELTDVWPYFLEGKFGEKCLSAIFPTALAAFDESDCLRVAMQMRLPIIHDGKLPLPVDLTVPNPAADSPFKQFRIQSVRNEIEGENISPYTWDDEPFDANFDAPYFALYGVGEDGLLEHIADRKTCAEAVNLVRKIAPGVKFHEFDKSSSPSKQTTPPSHSVV
jgi:hypothetical protein